MNKRAKQKVRQSKKTELNCPSRVKDKKVAKLSEKRHTDDIKQSSQDRYDPWRVKNDPSRNHISKVESFVLGVTLAALFLGSYGIGWALGGLLRQKINQTDTSTQAQVAEQDSTTGSEDDEGTNDPTEADNQDSDQTADQDHGPESEASADDPNLAITGVKSDDHSPDGAIPAPDITGKKLIALTFDDGPSGAITDQLLAHLRQKQVRATFFVLGYMAERSPQQLQKEIREGHEVGSHTAGHTAFSKMSAADLVNDSARMNQIFTDILGHNTPFMRPPYGDGAYTEKARVSIGQPMILWTVDTLDWKYRDAPTVRNNAVKDAFDGAIILFHDIYQSTADAIPAIIDDLRAQGYEFLTVSELARARGVTMQNGAVYGSFKP